MSKLTLPPPSYLCTVGRPISVQQKDHPTDAELDEVQARYIAELKRCVRCPPPAHPCALPLADDDFVQLEQHLGELQRDLRKESDPGTHHHCMTRDFSRVCPTMVVLC